MIVKVAQNQTIWDIALQYAGSVEAALDILEANGKADTTLFVGEDLIVPKVLNRRVATFFESESAVANSLEPLSEDTWVAPSPACLPAYYQILFNGFIVDSGTLASGELSQINIDEYANQWQRHPLWPTIPETPDRAFILWAVFDDEPINAAEITVCEEMIVSWGDGNISTVGGATRAHSYDYASIDAPEIESYDGRNYKPVLISVNRNGGNASLFWTSAVEFRTNNSLEVEDRLFVLGNEKNYRISFNPESNNMNYHALYLERLSLNSSMSNSFHSGAFANITRLKEISLVSNFLPTSGSAAIPQRLFYNSSIPSLIEMSISVNQNCQEAFASSKLKKVTSFIGGSNLTSLFRGSTVNRIALLESSATSTPSILRDTRQLIQATLKLPLLTDISNSFNGSAVQSIVFLSNMGSVTNTNGMFSGTGNISNIIMPGLTRGFDVSNNKLQVAAIELMFLLLGTANGTQVINISSNPGALTCDTSIATNKGFTVITA